MHKSVTALIMRNCTLRYYYSGETIYNTHTLTLFGRLFLNHALSDSARVHSKIQNRKRGE